jgi:hypothetical protein
MSVLVAGLHPHRYRVEHILMEPFLISPVLSEEHTELREFENQGSRHFGFGGPAVAGGEFLDGARGEAHHAEAFPSPDSLYLIHKDIEDRGVAVVGKEGFFDRQDFRLEVMNEREDYSPAFDQGFMGGFLFPDDLGGVVEELPVLKERHAHISGTGIDSQDPFFVLGHWFGEKAAKDFFSGSFHLKIIEVMRADSSEGYGLKHPDMVRIPGLAFPLEFGVQFRVTCGQALR